MDQEEDNVISYCVSCDRIERKSGWTKEKLDPSEPKPAGKFCGGCLPKVHEL